MIETGAEIKTEIETDKDLEIGIIIGEEGTIKIITMTTGTMTEIITHKVMEDTVEDNFMKIIDITTETTT